MPSSQKKHHYVMFWRFVHNVAVCSLGNLCTSLDMRHAMLILSPKRNLKGGEVSRSLTYITLPTLPVTLFEGFYFQINSLAKGSALQM